MEENFGIQ